MAQQVHVLFICLGNICRSPTADGVFRSKVKGSEIRDRIVVDSAGTGDWHIGHPPDTRAQSYAETQGYDLSELRARQVTREDFDRFDYILAMDSHNLHDLTLMQPANYRGRLSLILDYLPSGDKGQSVPDPYYGGDQGFASVFEMLEEACEHLLDHIERDHFGIC